LEVPHFDVVSSGTLSEPGDHLEQRGTLNAPLHCVNSWPVVGGGVVEITVIVSHASAYANACALRIAHLLHNDQVTDAFECRDEDPPMKTMADVAKEAGVSVSTVSHVINQTRVIRPETRARVLDAIARTGFVANTLARSLATSTTATIGLAVSAVSNFHFAEMVAGIDAAVRAAGNTLLLADTHENPAEELKVVQLLHRRRVDGILLAPVTGREGAALQYLRDLKIPATLVDRCAADDFDQIGVENVESTAKLTAHLGQNGHRRIGMVSGAPDVQTTTERVQGYRKALRRMRISFDRKLLVPGYPNAESAGVAVDQLLSLAEPPTALVIGNNHMTIGALRALGQRGLEVPRDMAVASFDDFDWADVFRPHLTTIAQPINGIAGRAVSMLLERISGYEGPPRTERLPGQWRHRESCGCAHPDPPEYG